MSDHNVHRIVTGSLAENCYVVSHRDGDAAVVDPGGEPELIAEHVSSNGLRVQAVVATHGHPDHIAAALDVSEAHAAPFHMHPADLGLLPRANFYQRFVEGGGDRIEVPTDVRSLGEARALELGSLRLEVVHTPGHTPGSVCFAVGDALFTGDTLASDGAGRADLPGGDPAALETSIALLAERWPSDTTVRPGHGEPCRLGDAVGRRAGAAERR